MNLHGKKSHGRLGIVLPALLAILIAAPAAAFQFNLGEVKGSLDSTLSYGLSWRVADRDQAIVGPAVPRDFSKGNAYSYNYDDGNLNYDKGDLISNTTKITSEMALDYNNFGLFVRGTAFYDFEQEEGDRARTPLRSEALDLVGSDIDLLDAYAWWNFELGDAFGQIRLGDQVLSWGESTFIQNSINTINPADLSKLRVPGAELKEALLPVGMVSASISPNENLTFEAFYQYDWEEVVIDPPGTYWSTNDFAGKGGDKVMLGFGDVPDTGNALPINTLLGVPRASNIYADDDGQYGLAMRVYAPGLNDTEFGFYFMNYHSRLPVISSITGDTSGLLAAGNIQTGVVPAIAGAYGDLTNMVIAGIGAGATQVQAGAIAQTLLAVSGDTTNPAFVSAVTAASTDAFAKSARYQVEYPEDIKLIGASFNTVLPDSGVALQGEISHRLDAPLQVDDLELLLATLEPLSLFSYLGGLGENPFNPNYADLILDPTYSQYDTITPFDIAANGGGIAIPGYRRLDVTQIQSTATKVFGPTFGADQFTLVGEAGVTYIHDMPSKSELRFDGPGTPTSGNPNHANPAYPLASHPGKPAEPSEAFADDTSWGYRMAGWLDFNDAIGAVTLSPRLAWAHDVSGTTPGPGGNFIEGRKAVTFGLGARYQATWSADLSYTNFFGAGRYNLVNDRDFVALNIKYSF